MQALHDENVEAEPGYERHAPKLVGVTMDTVASSFMTGITMKQRRRFLLRFGLRSILGLTTIVAVVCGVWLRQAQVQRDVCTRLKQVGVKVGLDEPSKWWSWLPKSVLSLGEGHYFCRVTNLDLEVKHGSPLLQKRHDNDLLVWVSRLSSLKSLAIDGPLVDPKDFPLLSSCRKLEELRLVFGGLVDEDIARLPRLPHLTTLNMSVNAQISGKYITASRFPKLESLFCRDTQLNDDAMPDIGRLRKLQILAFGRTKVTDVGVAALSSHKELKSIELTETQVTGIGIGSLQGLESLDLTSTDLEDEAFADIGKLHKLRSLSISDCIFVTDKGLKALAHHQALQSISADNCNLTDASTEVLSTISSLEYASLDDTNIRSLADLAACKRLAVLSISSSEVPVDDALRFCRHDSCQLLIQDPKNERENRSFRNFYGCMGGGPVYVTSSELASMAGEAVGNNGDELVLEGLLGLSAKHFENFGCDVTSLSLARSTVYSDLFPYLRNWPLLVDLDVTRSSVTNAELEAIGKLHNLRSLELGETAIDDLGMLKIESLTNLSKLSLDKTNVTPASLKLIKRFKLLDSLSLPFPLDASSLIELLEACPSLRSLECVSTGKDTRHEIVALDSLKLHDIEFTVEQLRRLLDLHMQRATDNSNLACQTLSDRHCEVLANYIEISELDLSHSLVTDVGIAHIAKLPKLWTLNLSDTDVTATGLRSLQANNELGTLVYCPKAWSVETVTALLELRSIKELGVPFSELPRDIAIALASGLKSRDIVWFEGGPEFADRNYYLESEVAWMAGELPFNPNSAQLMLVGSLIDETKIAGVIGSPAVDYGYVKNVNCKSDTLLAKLAECNNAKQLSLSGVQLSPSDIGKLRGLKFLELLSLENCELTNAHIAELATLQNLSTLVISCEITDPNELMKLTKLPRLRHLTVTTKEPTEKYEELKQRLGKRCEIVGLAR